MNGLVQTHRTLVLLASSNAVDRAVLEANLIREGYQVLVARNVAEALSVVRSEKVHIIVTDLELTGGGGFTLRRKTSDLSIPMVILSTRPIDDGVRNLASENSISSLIGAPFSIGRIRSEIQHEIGRARRNLTEDSNGVIRGNLEAWSAGDLLRLMNHQGRSGAILLKHHRGSARLHFRDGAITNAVCGEHQGEKALVELFDWRRGQFEIRSESAQGPRQATVRPARNIHRQTDDVLIDLLLGRSEWERQLHEIPRIAVPHIWQHDDLGSLETDSDLADRLKHVLDGKRTLLEAARAARVSSLKDVRTLKQLLKRHVVPSVVDTPSTDIETNSSNHKRVDKEPLVVVAPQRKRVPPGRITRESGVYVRKGNTVRRNLSLDQSNEDTLQEKAEKLALELDERRHRSRLITRLAWTGLFVLALSALAVYMMSRSDDDAVHVEVIEDSQEPTTSGK